ncbi:MAG: MFS transporter [bacterium]|nr:MFS transporter [bacterium]MDT8365454.1 MFS transporter [bacterium]
MTGEHAALGTDGEKVVPFRNRLAPLLFMTVIFLFNFLARFIWGPLLVPIEKDLGLSHTGAGSLFLIITIGYMIGLLISGFISQKISHPATIGYSCISCGVVLAGASMSVSLLYLCVSLVLLGFTTGIYLPSAIPTLTHGLAQRDYGKAYSFHEVSPSLCFILGPILANIMLRHYPWKMVLLPVAAGIFILGFIYLARPITGKIYGEAPTLKNIGRILSERQYWFLLFIFMLAAGANVGVYAMLPLYLQAGRGLDQTTANTLLSVSRIAAIFSPFLVGWVTDQFGAGRVLAVIVFFNGVATATLGVSSELLFKMALFVQPMLSTAFFPPIWTIMSDIVDPRARNLGVSLLVPPAFIIGAGVLPTIIGAFGDAGMFPAGFVLWGVLTFTSFWLVRFTLRTETN